MTERLSTADTDVDDECFHDVMEVNTLFVVYFSFQ